VAGPLVLPHPTLTVGVGDRDLAGVRAPASLAPMLSLSSPSLVGLEGGFWGLAATRRRWWQERRRQAEAAGAQPARVVEDDGWFLNNPTGDSVGVVK
jgi:hypothetical protein